MSDKLKKRAVWALAAATIVIAGVLSYFASIRPDALEHSLATYRQAAPAAKADKPAAVAAESSAGALSGYRLPGVSRPFISGGAAGIIGVAIAFVAIVVVGTVLKHAGRGERRS